MRIEKILESKKIRGLNTAWYRFQSQKQTNITLFFIHGFPDSPEVWDSQFEYFSENYNIIAPFLRGCGPSERSKDKSRYSMNSVLLDHLEILNQTSDQIIIVAHDIGGPHAGELSKYLGDRLKGLVLINAPTVSILKARLKNPKQIIKSWYVSLFLMPKVGEWALEQIGDRVLSRLRKTNPNPVHLVPHYKEIFKTVISSQKEKALNVKTLLICSKSDPYLVLPTNKEAKTVSKDAQIRVVKGKHWLYEEQNSRINGLIKDFIEAL